MKSVFIGHPGPYGDIIVCAPIAKNYFDRGYKVYWPARAEYLDLLSRFDYVVPVQKILWFCYQIFQTHT